MQPGKPAAVPRRAVRQWVADLFAGRLRLSPLWNPAFHVWIWFAIALAIKAVVEPVLHSTYPCFEGRHALLVGRAGRVRLARLPA